MKKLVFVKFAVLLMTGSGPLFIQGESVEMVWVFQFVILGSAFMPSQESKRWHEPGVALWIVVA